MLVVVAGKSFEGKCSQGLRSRSRRAVRWQKAWCAHGDGRMNGGLLGLAAWPLEIMTKSGTKA